MTRLQFISVLLLIVTYSIALGAKLLAPADYAVQFRETPNQPPSAQFLLGTDELGRDRLSRLFYACQTSLLLAPAAAALSTLLAAIVGTAAGYTGGWFEKLTMAGVDLFLSLPWLFLIITVRAVLPLNVAPAISVLVTFAILGCLGWAASARVVCAGVRNLRSSGFMLNARALGCRRSRLLAMQLAPNVKPVLWAQFLVSIPVFVLAEANLSMLGLGVAEPLPSLGGLMRELENFSGLSAQPWRLAPLAVLVVCVSAFQVLSRGREVEA
ncbi:MAG TPA: ABC transporter permease [Terriglobales bacterium]|nr:ABC transporter permease [Terriglobales bacterium]